MNSRNAPFDAQTNWYASEIDLANQTIVDVGANVGRLSQFFWDGGKGQSTIVSVEPLKQNIKAITKRARKAGANSNWRIEHCAVSDRSGHVQISPFYSKQEGWNSAIGDDEYALPKKSITVACKTLDEVEPNATVIKVDIEGHEYAVIEHAISKLVHARAWAVELHMVPGKPLEGILSVFAHHGFDILAASASAGGGWQSTLIPETLQWARIPVAGTHPNGGIFKMLHIIAKR
ncbi:MAG: FkbM family methyltransferase [Chromatiales bacterium]|nr:FkbM family methyltransferase [Chromatiales bacterium]